MMKTIGIGGQCRSGKDELANYLVSRLNQRYELPNNLWVRNAFANAVKKIFEDTFGVDRDFVEKWKCTTEIPPGFDQPIRDSLIMIGDGFRKMKSKIWIELAFRNQEFDQIISDARYINETLHIRSQGGLSILMWRPGFENEIMNDSEQQFMKFVRKLIPLNFDGVIPEHLEIPFDLWIRNDGNKDDLYAKVDNIVVPYIDKFWNLKQ